MSDNDEDTSFLGGLRSLAGEWVASKRRRLQTGTPDSYAENGGTVDRNYIGNDAVTRDDLRTVRDLRESGGLISELVHGKALMEFGAGANFEAEEDDAAEWLHEQFNDLDNLLINIGEDAEWFPAALCEIVETRSGDFSHLEFVEPWTVLPQTDQHGNVVAWEQEVTQHGVPHSQTFNPDEVASFVLNKSNGRDKTGVSSVLRAMDEIEAYLKHSHAVDKNIEWAAFRRMHVKVGREGGASYSDNELRRVRNKIDLEDNTIAYTGQDVEFNPIEAGEIDFESVTSHDIRKLAVALGVPIELASVISEGLGSGSQSDVRQQYFELQKQAKQRSLGGQFVEQVARILLRDYSPYDHEQNLDLVFGDHQSTQEVRELVDAIGEDMTVNERRRLFDLAELDDDDVGESYDTARGETTEDSGGADPLFGSAPEDRGLQDVGDIDTGDYPEAAQENAQMALDARDDHGNPNDCGTQVGWERANQLANGEDLSEDTIGRMASFARHEDNKDQGDEGREDCGWLMWNAWGGDEGIAWAEDKMDEFEEARENAAGSDTDFSSDGHRCLSNVPPEAYDAAEPWERDLLKTHQKLWDAPTDQRMLLISETQTPEFVKDRIRQALLGGALFSDFDTLPAGERNQLREFMLETLTSDGWTIDGLADQLQQLPGLDDRNKAETIARTETASVLNTAREEGYEEQGLGDSLFYWSGNLDGRQTEACEWLIRETNPNYGGDPVPMDELKALIEEAPTHDPDMDDNLARPENLTVHPNERKTFVRYVE